MQNTHEQTLKIQIRDKDAQVIPIVGLWEVQILKYRIENWGTGDPRVLSAVVGLWEVQIQNYKNAKTSKTQKRRRYKYILKRSRRSPCAIVGLWWSGQTKVGRWEVHNVNQTNGPFIVHRHLTNTQKSLKCKRFKWGITDIVINFKLTSEQFQLARPIFTLTPLHIF